MERNVPTKKSWCDDFNEINYQTVIVVTHQSVTTGTLAQSNVKSVNQLLAFLPPPYDGAQSAVARSFFFVADSVPSMHTIACRWDGGSENKRSLWFDSFMVLHAGPTRCCYYCCYATSIVCFFCSTSAVDQFAILYALHVLIQFVLIIKLRRSRARTDRKNKIKS